MTQNRQSGYGTGNAKIDLAPVPFGTMKTLGSGDYTYNLGQIAYEIALTQWVIYSGDGVWLPFTGVASGITTINTILPAVGGNFTLTAGAGIAITPGVNSVTISLTGGGIGIDSFTVPAGTSPVSSDGSGNINWPAGNGFSITGGTNSMTGNMVSPFTGSFGFTSAVSGANEVLSVSHTSNTANSNSIINAAVAGTSGGDPFIYFNVGSTSAWSIGIDTSSSQFKITSASASSVTPSTGDSFLVCDYSQLTAIFSVNNLSNTMSLPGLNLTIGCVNTDTANAASSSSIASGVAAATSGDPYFQLAIGPAVTCNKFGLKNSDSDAFYYNIGCNAGVSGLDGTTVLKIDQAATAATFSVATLSNQYLLTGEVAQIGVQNTATTNANSSARLFVTSQNGTGDSYVIFNTHQGTLANAFELGATQADVFLITSVANNDTMGISGNTLFSATTAGNITLGFNTSSIVGFNNTIASTVGAAGGASALPLTPSGYILVNINGSPFEIPYYARA